MINNKKVLAFLALLFNFLVLFALLAFVISKKFNFDNFFTQSLRPILGTRESTNDLSQRVKGESDASSYVLVKRVIDGDTIVLENGEVVRYIGIDTPEIAGKGDCYSKEATKVNSDLVLNKLVRLEKDVSERDRYQRLLRYVYVQNTDGSETFVNDYLVREGYARLLTYPPDVKYSQIFKDLEKRAREASLGLWKSCSN